jgi:hypothetical protein
MPTFKPLYALVGGALAMANALVSTSAAAREIYPGAIAEAADMACIPQCTLCHTSNPGTASTWQAKQLPKALLPSINPPATDAGMKAAWAAYAANPVNATAVAAVKAGEDPEYGGNVCNPSYGCGARMARRSERRNDHEVVLWGLLAVLGAAAARSRRRR